jgi:hypothetical protein
MWTRGARFSLMNRWPPFAETMWTSLLLAPSAEPVPLDGCNFAGQAFSGISGSCCQVTADTLPSGS